MTPTKKWLLIGGGLFLFIIILYFVFGLNKTNITT